MAIRSNPPWAVYVANVCADLGWRKEAKEAFDKTGGQDLADLPRDANWLICTQAVAISSAFIGDPRRGAIVYAMLEPLADRWANAAVSFCLGPVSTLLGIFATTLARYGGRRALFPTRRG